MIEVDGERGKVKGISVWREQDPRSKSTFCTIYDPFHTLKGTATGDPSRGLSHTIQRIILKQNEGETKTSVSIFI